MNLFPSTSTPPPAPTPIPTSSHSSRLSAIDFTRFLAALAVIYWHTPETSNILSAYHCLVTWAVPFFAAMIIYWLCLQLRQHPQLPFQPYLQKRLTRILLPFYAWSIIYLLARNIKRHWISHQDPISFHFHFLWTGPTHHLWFLPFTVLLSALAFFPLKYAASNPSFRTILSILCIPLGLFFAIANNPFNSTTHYLFFQSWHALPAALWAVPLAYWLPLISPSIQHKIRWLILSLLILSVFIFLYFSFTPSYLSNSLLALLILFTTTLPWNHPFLAKLAPLRRLAYGIYLIHILFLMGMPILSQKLLHLSPGIQTNLVSFFSAAILSTLATFALSKSPKTRWLVPN